MTRAVPTDCYAWPQYWDIAFRSETKREADFLEAAARRYAQIPVRRILEPGCGGGRLVVKLARRGFDVTGFDISPSAVQYVRSRLKRRGLPGTVLLADMAHFDLPHPVDAAICPLNTFRHLVRWKDAVSHLRCVARALVPGGLYVLGLHLMPAEVDGFCQERWRARHGKTTVTFSLRVLHFDLPARRELIRFCLHVRRPGGVLRLRTDTTLRIYTARDMRRLLDQVPELELCDVFDFWYDIDEPLELDDEIADCVLVLRRRR